MSTAVSPFMNQKSEINKFQEEINSNKASHLVKKYKF